jgi:protein SCO1/2
MAARIIAALLALNWICVAQLQAPRPAVLNKAGVEQRMGAQAPLDLAFNDEAGRRVTLREFAGKPIILALVYYQCPSLCNMILNGVLRSVKTLKLNAGDEFQIVAVSFDPRETPMMAEAKKQAYLRSYDRRGAEAGWHFLTGDEKSSKTLADAVGFRYAYDAISNQYAHGSAIMLLTPNGRVSKYFYGIEYPPRDLRLALVEASNHRIGSIVDQVMLYCYHYDPSVGKYGLLIMRALRLAGLITLSALIAFMLVMFRREFRWGS